MSKKAQMRSKKQSLAGEAFCVDVESTGLPGKDDVRLAQIGGVGISASGRVSAFDRYIRPDRPMTADASEVNGLTDDFLAQHGAPAKDVLTDFLKVADGKALIAHNALGFDVPILACMSRLYCPISPRDLQNPIIDTLVLSRLQGSGFTHRGHKLEHLLREIDPKFAQTHGALDDARALIPILDRLRGNLGDLNQLHNLCGSRRLSDYFMVPDRFMPKLSVLQTAIDHGYDLDLTYQSQGKQPRRRTVTPLCVLSHNHFYVYCHERQRIVLFLFESIHQIHGTSARFVA